LLHALLSSGLAHWELGARVGNFDVDIAPVNVLVIHQINRFLGILARREFHKAVAQRAGTAGDYVRSQDVTGNAEFLTEFVRLDFEGQITNEHLGGHDDFFRNRGTEETCVKELGFVKN